CATVAWPAQPTGRPPALGRVLGQLHDSRAARASKPKQGRISSRLLPPPTVGPLVGGLVAAPPPLGADGTLHVYLECAPLGLRRSGVKDLIGAGVDPHTVMAFSGHRTPSMLRRYHIIALDDLRAAAEKGAAYQGRAAQVTALGIRKEVGK